MCIPGSVLLFLAKFVEIDVTVGTQKTKFAHVARTGEVRVPPMTIFFAFFYFLVCKASSILSHSQFPRNPAKLRYESAKYRDYLLFCVDPGGVHCVTFAAAPITAQLLFMHF